MDEVNEVEGRTARKRVVHVAKAVMAGTADLLDACREIVSARAGLSHPEIMDEDLLVFVGVESDLDDVPSGSARLLWEPQALAAKEQRSAEYLSRARPEIMRACVRLIKKWG